MTVQGTDATKSYIRFATEGISRTVEDMEDETMMQHIRAGDLPNASDRRARREPVPQEEMRRLRSIQSRRIEGDEFRNLLKITADPEFIPVAA
jgi:hypothetical protein